MNNQDGPQNEKSATNSSDHQDVESQSVQPESGAVDRQEQMKVRQSSPTNPRVADKPEINQEEA